MTTGYYDTISRYYDAENLMMVDDMLFYSQLAEEHGDPILEIGAGSGRVLVHLVQQGSYQLVGVDISDQMLTLARRKLQVIPGASERVKLVKANILNYDDDTRYPLILLTYNALMHFVEQEDQVTLMKKLRSMLAEDGLIVIDLPNAAEVFAADDDNAIHLERTFLDPETENTVMQQTVSSLDRVRQQLYVTWIYDEIAKDGTVKRLVAPQILHYFYFAELQLLCQLVGLEIAEMYGDYERNPFEDGADRMILIARAAR